MTPVFVVRRIGFYVLIGAITLFFAIPMLWIASAPFDSSPGLGVHWPDWTLDNVRKTLNHTSDPAPRIRHRPSPAIGRR